MQYSKLLVLASIFFLVFASGCGQQANKPKGDAQPAEGNEGAEYYRSIALQQQEQGETEEAVASLLKAAELAKDANLKADIYADMVILYNNLERPEKALESLKAALALANNRQLRLKLHGMSYFLSKKADDAAGALKSLYYIRSNDPHPKTQAWVEEQKALLFTGPEENSRIAAALESQLQAAPDDTEMLELMVYVYQGVLNESTKAIACLEKLAAKNKRFLLALAEAYESQGEKQKAAAAYRELLPAVKDGNVKILERLADLYVALGDGEAARKCITETAPSVPRTANDMTLLADIAMRADMAEESLAYLEEAVKLEDEPSQKAILGLTLGERLADSGRTEQAGEEFLKILREKSAGMYHFGAAVGYFDVVRRKDTLAGAVAGLEEERKADPRNPVTLFMLLTAYTIFAPDSAKASETCEAFYNASDMSQDTLFKIESLCNAGPCETALAVYDKLAELAASRKNFYLREMAYIHKSMGDTEKYVACLEQCANEESLPYELGELARAYMEAGEPGQAVETLRKAVAREESEGCSPNLREQLAEALESAGKTEEAEKVLAETLNTAGGMTNRMRITRHLVEVAAKSGGTDRLQQESEKKLESAPADVTALATLAWICRLQKKDADKAIVVLEKLCKLEPYETAYLASLYAAYDMAGRADDAEKLPGEGKTAPGTHPAMKYLTIAEACLESDRVETAKKNIDKFLEESTNPGAYIQAGNLLRKFGLHEDAVALFRKGIERAQPGMEKDSSELHLARCLTGLKRYDEAAEILAALRARVAPHSPLMRQITLLSAEIERAKE